ncbi:MAG: hypothetical protein HZA49_01545 [Planctomycetes bacterium]|nr:hypothetical protein [Planctomycetota bacterium]
MSENTEKYKHPRWFRIIVITYIALAIIFFLVFLIAAFTKGDRPVQQGTLAYTLIFWGGSLLLWFTVMGIPSLAFLSWGLSSKNKILKYFLYALSAGWLILFILMIIFN